MVVTATDDDPDTPVGTERAVPPVVDGLVWTLRQFNTAPPFGAYDWYAKSVTWSPDRSELLYQVAKGDGSGCCLLAVPVDDDQSPRVLDGDSLIGQADELIIGPWLPLQKWQGRP